MTAYLFNAAQGILLLAGVWAICAASWWIVETFLSEALSHAQHAIPDGVFGPLPRCRTRLAAIPDLALLLHAGGRVYARMVTASGHVHHYSIAHDGLSRDTTGLLCGRRAPYRRATRADLRNGRRRLCSGCRDAVFNGTAVT